MWDVHTKGRAVVNAGHPGTDGARRDGDARVRVVGHRAEGRLMGRRRPFSGEEGGTSSPGSDDQERPRAGVRAATNSPWCSPIPCRTPTSRNGPANSGCPASGSRGRPRGTRWWPGCCPTPTRTRDEASEFRGLTEAGLRATKLAHISRGARATAATSPIVITDDVRAWLAFLADARLMLGTRLEVTEDDDLRAQRRPRAQPVPLPRLPAAVPGRGVDGALRGWRARGPVAVPAPGPGTMVGC